MVRRLEIVQAILLSAQMLFNDRANFLVLTAGIGDKIGLRLPGSVQAISSSARIHEGRLDSLAHVGRSDLVQLIRA